MTEQKTKAQLLVDVYNGKITIDELKHSKQYAEVYFSSPAIFDTADLKRRQDTKPPIFQSCFFITGNQAGIGKSCFCELIAKQFSKNDIHISSETSVPFDHYEDQDAIVGHDFRAGDIKEIGGLPKFLNLINPQKLNTYTNVKHSSVKLKNRYGFFDSIVSVERLIEFSCSIKENENGTLQQEPAAQMYRRIIPIQLDYDGVNLFEITFKKATKDASKFDEMVTLRFHFTFDSSKKIDPNVYKFYNILSNWTRKFGLPNILDFDYEAMKAKLPPSKIEDYFDEKIEIFDIKDFEL